MDFVNRKITNEPNSPLFFLQLYYDELNSRAGYLLIAHQVPTSLFLEGLRTLKLRKPGHFSS